MERLDDKDIGTIWERHYPKRSGSESSRSLLLTLQMIITRRAHSIVQYSAWDDKLRHILAAAGIPKEQFDTIVAESKSDPLK